MGGVVIGHEVARALGCRMVFTERVAGAMALRRSLAVEAGERALVVENVISTGGSALEVCRLLTGSGAIVVALATIVDRTPATTRLGVPVTRLARVSADSYDPVDCPACRAGLPVDSPGSRRLTEHLGGGPTPDPA
jgi:orotate phosphoribosyltransferase